MNAVLLVARRSWRRLISMRTALVLLFLLAVAAVPGSLVPQRPLNPEKVQRYLAEHGAWGRFLDRIGAFDVFGSPWFAATYLLLFASLVGCLIPRIKVHIKGVLAKPLPAPRRLSRLPESARYVMAESPAESADRTREALGRRWRVVRRQESGGVVTLSAEKGYTRETGNLVFHVALLATLVAIAVGQLFSYTGTVIVTEGSGFCNTVISYDSFSSGRLAQDGQVAPFCIDRMNSFTAQYRADGSPQSYQADVTYSRGADGAPEHEVIRVNHPLRIEGDRVYLLNHGYSPTVTVRTPDGDVRTETAVFVPQDTKLTSEGAFKLQYAGEGNDIGIEGLFAPTATDVGDGVIVSTSPVADDPVLAVFVYQGDLGLAKGIAQSVYSLDPIQKSSGALTKVASQNLAMGDTMTLPDGTTVTFDGVAEWASFQVSHDPAQTQLLIASVAMVLGLIASLTIRRRRVWVRFTPQDEPGTRSRTVVEVGGLARNDSGNFATEFAGLVQRLRAVETVVGPDDPPQRSADVVGVGSSERSS